MKSTCKYLNMHLQAHKSFIGIVACARIDLDTLFVFSRPFYDRRMGQEIDGEVMGEKFKGYIFRITGGNDK